MSKGRRYHILTTFTDYEFEEPRKTCVACESKELVYWDSIRSMPIVKCRGCGLKFVNPLPTDECIRKFYDGGLSRWSNIDEYEQNRADYFVFYLNLLQKYHPQRNKLLDIGCGIGTFMKMATERMGWISIGIDISKSDIEIARNRGLNVVDIDAVKQINPSEFDFCTMLDFLEHVKDPNYYLGVANRSLSKGGLLLIDTGDTGGLPEKIGKARNPFVQNEGHLLFWDRKSISKLLTNNGFEITDILDQSMVQNIPWIRKIALLLVSRPNMVILATKSN